MIFSFFFWSAFLLPPAGCCCFLGGMAGRAERPQLSLGGSQGRGEGGAERDGRGGDGTAAPPPPGRRNGSRPRGTLGTQRQAPLPAVGGAAWSPSACGAWRGCGGGRWQ